MIFMQWEIIGSGAKGCAYLFIPAKRQASWTCLYVQLATAAGSLN